MSSPQKHYDYIISGSGCAGLSLLMHMIYSGKFRDKKILLVDKEQKKRNDRTWCFWETDTGLFEPIIFRKWQKVWFHGENASRLLEITPYTYKLIRGIDFYEFCFREINRHENIDLLTGKVEEIDCDDEKARVVINGQTCTADYVFNSIVFEKPKLAKHEYYLLQHFKGWIIETRQEVFNPDEATLMDFRISQERGAAFVYVMPFSSTRALVEYTLFTDKLLEQGQYDDGLRKYISQYIFKGPYKISDEEFGVIPMTNYKFSVHQKRVINIGTAGGQTKASSGYTFKNIQKSAAALVDRMISSGDPYVRPASGKRFHFYDSVLLSILVNKNHMGRPIFTDLFMKNKPEKLLKFLDNESSLAEELRIISSLPTMPFLKAAFKQIGK